MHVFQALREFGAWLGTFPWAAQISLFMVYGAVVPLLMGASFVGSERIIRDARSASGESEWARWLFDCVRRRRRFWVFWTAVAAVCAAEALLVVATVAQPGKDTLVATLEKGGGIGNKGWTLYIMLLGVGAGVGLLVRLPKARRCAINEAGEA